MAKQPKQMDRTESDGAKPSGGCGCLIAILACPIVLVIFSIVSGAVTFKPRGSTATEATAPESGVVGRWTYAPVAAMAGEAVVRMSDEGLVLDRSFPDGSSLVQRLREVPSPAGRRFDKVDSVFGEFLILRADGRLEFHDVEGLIYTATPITP
ncbi:MAG: hypothetical protein AAGJ54_03945 [Planctomycetota bacterium]